MENHYSLRGYRTPYFLDLFLLKCYLLTFTFYTGSGTFTQHGNLVEGFPGSFDVCTAKVTKCRGWLVDRTAQIQELERRLAEHAAPVRHDAVRAVG